MHKPLPSQEHLRELFDYQGVHLYWKEQARGRRLGRPAGSVRTDGRRIIRLDKQTYKHSRVVWTWHHGEIPEGLVVDHIDENPADDRIENLQLLTNQENVAKGFQKFRTDGLPPCVYYRPDVPKSPYRAQRGNNVIGYFATVDEAVLALGNLLIR